MQIPLGKSNLDFRFPKTSVNLLVKSGQDLTTPRNLIIVAVILVCGIGGMKFTAGAFAIEKIGLAGVLGLLLNIILPQEKGAESS